LAALTGRARTAAALLGKSAADTEHVPFFTPQGTRPALSSDIVSGALQLLAYASLGGPADSVRATFLHTDKRVLSSVHAGDRQVIREMLFRNSAGFAYPQLAPLIHFPLPPARDVVLEMRQALAAGDTAGA